MTSTVGASRGRLQAAALGVIGALLVPLPAAAAPAPCEQALRYAAQSGTGLMRIGHLDLGPAGRTDQPITDVSVGEVKSALVAQAPINAAALGRVLDSGPADGKALAEVLQQTAPPNQTKPEQRMHDATEAGPFRLGKTQLTASARWQPGMACGNAAGEATRAEVELRRAGVLDGEDGALVRVPQKISGLSTTAMERRGAAARAAASASMTGGRIDLLGGVVKIKIVQPPSLLATMSGTDGGEVRYRPAVLEVSGAGFETARLDTAGDNVELQLDEDGNPNQDQSGTAKPRPAEPDATKPNAAETDAAKPDAAKPGAAKPDAAKLGAAKADATKPDAAKPGATKPNAAKTDAGQTDAGQTDAAKTGAGQVGAGQVGAGQVGAGQVGAGQETGGPGASGVEGTSTDADPLFAGLPTAGALGSAKPLPLPPVPAVPPLIDPDTEAAPAAGPGTTVRVSLGDVRQAVSGHAIAAKATAIRIAIAKGSDRQAYAGSNGVVLDLDLGLLEVAAVAPEPAGGTADATGGAAGGLPITGPRVDLLALTGVALLIAGAVALVFGMRGRSRS